MVPLPLCVALINIFMIVYRITKVCLRTVSTDGIVPSHIHIAQIFQQKPVLALHCLHLGSVELNRIRCCSP